MISKCRSTTLFAQPPVALYSQGQLARGQRLWWVVKERLALHIFTHALS